jgi:GNAT superfamily N-acetyltransferase
MNEGLSNFQATGDRVALVAEGATTLGVVRLIDGERVGQVRLSQTVGELVIDALCIDAQHRSHGAGSEAAWLLVAAARAAGIARLRTWAHPNLGLSVYFWTRMGFSPRHGEGPEGGIWFEREL